MLGLCCWAWVFSSCSKQISHCGEICLTNLSHCLSFWRAWALDMQASGTQLSMWAQQSCCKGSVVPQHVGSPWVRDQTHVPCISRLILNHWIWLISSSLVLLCQGWFRNWTCVLRLFSLVWLFVTLWIVACQAPLSMGYSRQEYWNGLPCPPPGYLSNPGIFPTRTRVSYVSCIGRWILYH